MGVYHIVVNETKREWLEPGEVNGGAIKHGFVLCGIANLTLWKMNNDWKGDNVVIVDDTTDHYTDVETSYKNVTKESVEAFNKDWKQVPEHHLRYTPYKEYHESPS